MRWSNKLSRQERAEIKQRLHQSSPEEVLAPDMRIDSGQFWTVSDLRIAVKEWYGVVYKSEDSYRKLLHECQFSYFVMQLLMLYSQSILLLLDRAKWHYGDLTTREIGAVKSSHASQI